MWRALAAQGNGAPTPIETADALNAALAADKTSVWVDFFSPRPKRWRCSPRRSGSTRSRSRTA